MTVLRTYLYLTSSFWTPANKHPDFKKRLKLFHSYYVSNYQKWTQQINTGSCARTLINANLQLFDVFS